MITLNSLLLRKPRRNAEERKILLQEPETLLQEPEKITAFEAPQPAGNSSPHLFEHPTLDTEAMTPAWKALFAASNQDASKENDDFFHDGETNLLPVLEKICSLLEQIAESVENCSRKLDSEEDDELKYN